MFTNEFESDCSITTIMDETGELEDVHVIIDDDSVIIRQWNEFVMAYDLITLSPVMYYELLQSRNQPEGLYTLAISSAEKTSV